jgi:hypothetical protein
MDDVVFLERFDEFDDMCAHGVRVSCVLLADLLCDADLLVTTLEELEDLRPHDIQAEHLAVAHVEQNFSVGRSRSPDGLGNSKHHWLRWAKPPGSWGAERTLTFGKREFQKTPLLFAIRQLRG